MKVKELKNAIADLPDDMEIILQKDGEGNGCSPLSGADSWCIYVPDTSYNREVYSLDWSADDAGLSEQEWEERKANDPKVLVLFPVN